MGLYRDILVFPGEPPSERELADHLRGQIGELAGIESYTVEDRRAELCCMLDPYTRPYALAFLVARGGAAVHARTGAPVAVRLPEFVRTPWRELSRRRRLRIAAAYHWSLWFGRPSPQ